MDKVSQPGELAQPSPMLRGKHVQVFSTSNNKWVTAEVLDVSSSRGIDIIYCVDDKQHRKTVPLHTLFIPKSLSTGEGSGECLPSQDIPSPLGEGRLAPVQLPICCVPLVLKTSGVPYEDEDYCESYESYDEYDIFDERCCNVDGKMLSTTSMMREPHNDDVPPGWKVCRLASQTTRRQLVTVCRIGIGLRYQTVNPQEHEDVHEDHDGPDKVEARLEVYDKGVWISIDKWTLTPYYSIDEDFDGYCWCFQHDLPAPGYPGHEWRLWLELFPVENNKKVWRSTDEVTQCFVDVQIHCLGDDVLKDGLLRYCQEAGNNRLLAETALATLVRDSMAPRPPWLPSKLPGGHEGQLAVSPDLWSLTFKQYRRLMMYIRDTDRYRKIKESRLSEGKVVTLYDLNDWFIRPWTANTGGSIALLLNPAGLAVQLMASHAWAEDCEELQEALERYFQKHSLPENIAIWICTFANYQPKPVEGAYDCGPTIAQQIKLDPFAKVIGALSLQRKLEGCGMVAVHTTKVNLYSRLWCPYEMNQAVKKRVQVKMATSEAYESDLKEAYLYYKELAGGDEKEAFELWPYLRIDTKNARCSCESDQRMISKNIEDEGGYERLDKIIFLLRKKCITELCA